eukprot:1157345-Pelagomonas_calceolata.AAC.6
MDGWMDVGVYVWMDVHPYIQKRFCQEHVSTCFASPGRRPQCSPLKEGLVPWASEAPAETPPWDRYSLGFRLQKVYLQPIGDALVQPIGKARAQVRTFQSCRPTPERCACSMKLKARLLMNSPKAEALFAGDVHARQAFHTGKVRKKRGKAAKEAGILLHK